MVDLFRKHCLEQRLAGNSVTDTTTTDKLQTLIYRWQIKKVSISDHHHLESGVYRPVLKKQPSQKDLPYRYCTILNYG